MTTDREPTLEEQIEACEVALREWTDKRWSNRPRKGYEKWRPRMSAAAATLRRVRDGSLVREAIEAWKAAQELTTRLP